MLVTTIITRITKIHTSSLHLDRRGCGLCGRKLFRRGTGHGHAWPAENFGVIASMMNTISATPVTP